MIAILCLSLSFSMYISRAHYVPRTVLGHRNLKVSKIGKMSSDSYGAHMTVKK